MMIYKYWESVTREDLEFAVGGGAGGAYGEMHKLSRDNVGTAQAGGAPGGSGSGVASGRGGIRSDGRKRDTTRLNAAQLSLAAVAQASGSCWLSGPTAVLAGVKVSIGNSSSPAGPAGRAAAAADAETDAMGVGESDAFGGGGRVVCTVECAPALLPQMDPRAVEDMCVDYANFVTKLLNSGSNGLDLRALAIVPNAALGWVVHVDALVLSYAGNLLDTIVMAVRGALCNTLIPKVSVEESPALFGAGMDYEFDMADEETEPLVGCDDIPVVVTLFKIGNYCVIDPNPLEESCSDVQLTVAVTRSGVPCAIQKRGNGSLEPSLLAEMLRDARKHAVRLFALMDDAISRERLRLANME
ncbi:Exosome complex component RRP42 [Entophlyctis luteolus]|nr:Exosome complex component RRP42 [Entophlyctis luteolus]